jgi:hypothetical protein
MTRHPELHPYRADVLVLIDDRGRGEAVSRLARGWADAGL